MSKFIKLATTAIIFSSTPSLADNDTASMDIIYKGDVFSLVSGGLDSGATRYMDNLDIQLTLDTSAWAPKGGTLFIYGMYNNNRGFDGDVIGSHNGTSNIENSRLFRLEEAWYEQRFMDGKASLKFGLIDLNSEFDAIDPAGLFINPAHGIGTDFSQSGPNGPSIFPNTSLAVSLAYDFGDNWSYRVGIFDGTPNDPDRPQHHAFKLTDGALITSEINKELDNGWRIGAGIWHYTKEQDRVAPTLSGITTATSQGAYAFAHGPISETVDAWVRFGKASQKTNPFSGYLGMGLVKNGIFGREDDQLGFAIARSKNGNLFMRSEAATGNFMDKTETNLELTYRYQLNDSWAVQPDVQYIFNPGTDPTVKNAFSVGLRFEAAFSL